MNFNIILIIAAVAFAMLGSYVGLSQGVIWAFIGGFIVADLLQRFLSSYIGFNFLYGYGMFVSCIVGIVCAFLAQSRDNLS